MKTQTAREKAEALVALIRTEFPLPSINGGPIRDPSQSWYCVGGAYWRFSERHPEMVPYVGWPGGNKRTSIAYLNNEGKFEEAWNALADELTLAYQGA